MAVAAVAAAAEEGEAAGAPTSAHALTPFALGYRAYILRSRPTFKSIPSARLYEYLYVHG